MSEILLRGGQVIDGTGAPMRSADVLVENGKIRRIGRIGREKSAAELDCAGAYVCPGFIDPHRHIDAALLRQRGYGEVELRQGITTAVGGNCGLSLAPCSRAYMEAQRAYLKPVLGSCEGLPAFETFASFLRAADEARPSINAGFFVGNGTARMNAFGFAAPESLPADRLEAALAGIREALSAGAFGLSMGLMYVPEANYTVAELALCASEAAHSGAPVPAHIRGEGVTLPQSLRELLRIGRESGARVGVSHFKAAGRAAWGAPFDEALAALAEARASGQTVYADAYPYEAGSTTLLSLLPPDWQSDGFSALARRLSLPEERARLREILAARHAEWDNQLANPGWEDTILISAAASESNRPRVGLYIGEIARRMGAHPVDAIAEMLAAEPDGVSIISFSMDPANVRRVYALADTMVISDSVLPEGPKHPRYAGAFPRFFARFARGADALFSPEEAVRRMSGLTASVYGLRGKGFLREGFDADIAVIEPEEYTDRAEYARPDAMAAGVRYALVNGQIAVRGDEVVARGLGRALRREAERG